MHPIIGITTSVATETRILQMNPCYTEAVAHAGGVPVMLPVTQDRAMIARYAAMLDGLLLSGGDDIDPLCYGALQAWECGDVSPARDAFELALCREVLGLGKPVFGICRGIQLLNVAMGGTLYQDLRSELPGSIAHRQHQKPEHASHPVSIAADSLLRRIAEADTLTVNSHHHQALRDVAPGLVVTASAPDGVIEAVEHAGLPFCLGVQWHPERLTELPGHAALFRAFVEACRT